MGRTTREFAAPAVGALLVLAVALIFGKTLSYDFVNYDDGLLVYDNPIVARGLTAEGAVWACTTRAANMWSPLTWISYMLDRQMYGGQPWGYHCTNVLLHAATTVILFLILRRMTGNLWASACVALLFAIHPLRAESVAWVSERKGLLGGFFAVSTIAAYVAYTRHPLSLARYLAVTGLFALGLLATPALATLPFLLLLLDYWPLKRWQGGTSEARGAFRVPVESSDDSFRESDYMRILRFPQPLAPRTFPAGESAWLLVLEKVPLVFIGVAGCVAAVMSQAGNIASSQGVPTSAWIANTLISYAVYLGQTVWPTGLAVCYPRSETYPAWQVAGVCLLLALFSAAAFLSRRRQPAVLVGWLWYLGALLPMIGLALIGGHARADRYTYLPHVGLFIAVVWGVRWGAERLWVGGPSRRWLYGAAGALLVAGFLACAWRQTSYWQDSETLWTRALACTDQNPIAHNGLGAALARRGRTHEALGHFRTALEIKPDYADAHLNLGLALEQMGKPYEATGHDEQAPRITPDDAIQDGGGVAQTPDGNLAQAAAHYAEAIKLQTGLVVALNNLAWIRATSDDPRLRDGAEALRLAQRACQLAGRQEVGILDTLAAAYAAVGRFSEAVATAQEAVALARSANQSARADAIQVRLDLYRAGQSYREPSANTPHKPSPPAGH